MIKIVDGIVQGATQMPTAKHGGTITPTHIVLHYTAGWTTQGDIAQLFKKDNNVSVHLLLSREGQWVQGVSLDKRAWHAGPSKHGDTTDLNSHSIGIEICNAGWVKKLSNGMYQDQYGQMIRSDGKFVGSERKTSSPVGDWPQERNERLATGTYVWEPYAAAQLDALDQMVAALLKEYPTIESIVSHEEIDTRGWKTDPGPLFPMRRYTRMVESRAGNVEKSAPVETIPVAVATPQPRSWWRFWG